MVIGATTYFDHPLFLLAIALFLPEILCMVCGLRNPAQESGSDDIPELVLSTVVNGTATSHLDEHVARFDALPLTPPNEFKLSATLPTDELLRIESGSGIHTPPSFCYFNEYLATALKRTSSLRLLGLIPRRLQVQPKDLKDMGFKEWFTFSQLYKIPFGYFLGPPVDLKVPIDLRPQYDENRWEIEIV